MRLGKVFFLVSLFLALVGGCKEKETQSFNIGFSQCTGNDAWRRDMLRGMKQELAFYPEVSFTYKDAQGNSRRQVEQIKELLAADLDLLIVSPNEAEPITPVMEEAYQQGIPVVVVDRKPSSSFYTAFVGGNNYEVGKTAGQYIGALLQGQGTVLEITGLPSSSPAIDRHQGFADALKKFPGIHVAATLPGDWEKHVAKRQLQPVLDKAAGVDLIFAHNDVMALGAYEVWKKSPQRQPIKIVGVDGLAGPLGGVQMVNDKILNATMLYPTGGEEAIRLAMQILHKKPFNKENILNTAVIDSSNARMIKMQTDKILNQQADIERQQQKIEKQVEIYHNQQVFLYIMSGLLFCSILFGALALYWITENKKINQQLQASNQEVLEQRNQLQQMAEAAQAATESKFRFFTNISHEFRTPLTLILSPLDGLLHGKSDHLMMKQSLKLIQKNAQRLLWLVNQLMDFRKLESGRIQVKATENDLVAFIRDIMLPFEQMAQKRRIEFRFITSLASLPVWFDTNMMDKVLFNLLSNAFKFVPDHGRIHIQVEAHPEGKLVYIRVKDTGIGMTEAEAARAFEMFYQADSAAHKGTGLGLPLSKEFIELHHGRIQVASEPNKGTIFEIALQLGKAHFQPEELAAESPGLRDDLARIVEDATPVWEPGTGPEKKNQSVLLIEDHPELRSFLQFTLQSAYQVLTAGQGQQGLQEARDHIPDLIICDLNLPDINGLQVVASLKSDLRTSHIPVIILTAKSSLEQQIEGMQAGADLYLTKPFSPQFLKESIKSLLANRQLLKDRFGTGQPVHLEQNAALSKLDKKFLEDFKNIIDARLPESSLSVDSLSREIGLSRVQLYRKVKALLDCNVNDYIQTVRLNKSCQLLQDARYTIADVAYQVGFSSATYFSTAFKARFGVSPTDYRAQRKFVKVA